MPGTALPVIDRNRCEGKAECLTVCPYDVFDIRRLTPAEREGMTLLGTLKSWAHGHRQALVARPADCGTCGLCVKACPENAIALRKV